MLTCLPSQEVYLKVLLGLSYVHQQLPEKKTEEWWEEGGGGRRGFTKTLKSSKCRKTI